MGGLYDEALIALHGIWHRRWLALAVGWGIALLGWLIVGLIPNSYKSEARIHVQSQSLLPDKIGITANERAAGVDALRQTLTSVANLEKVVRGTDLAAHVTTAQDMAEKTAALQKSITVIGQADNLVQISDVASESGFSDAQNARLATQVVQKLVDLFVDGNMRNGVAETSQSLKFLDAQIDQRAKQLAEVDGKRAAFEAKYLSDLPGSGSIADRIGQARSEVAQIESQLAAAQSGLAAVNGQMAATPASTQTPGTVIAGSASAADGRAAAIEAQIADGQARGWTDAHPDMVALRSQLARARAQGGGGTASRMSPGISSPNPMYVSLRSMQAERQATASALAGRKAELEGQINRIQTLQQSNPEFSAEQTAIDRDYAALKVQYDKLLADREDVKLRGQVQTQTDAIKFDVIEPPSSPRVPAAPNRPLLLTLVLVAALAGGAGAAFAQGQLQNSYPTAGRLERASGLPVIGSITEVVTDPVRDLRKQRLRQFAGGTAALFGVWILLMLIEFVERSMVA